MTDPVVYLANSSGIKVGITRATQLPTRWLDQGASQALPIMRVATRQQSGMVEDLLRSQVADRTNWRALLKGDAEPIDLIEMREQIFDACADGLRELQQRSEEHTSELQSLMRISYAVFFLKKKTHHNNTQ